MLDIADLDFTEAVVKDNGKMHENLIDWAAEVTNKINFHAVATGSGSPEGVLIADITKRYMDTAGTAGLARRATGEKTRAQQQAARMKQEGYQQGMESAGLGIFGGGLFGSWFK